MRVLVIDGQGGGLGRQLVTAITALCPEVELTAVGVPAEVVRINNKAIVPSDDLDQQDVPDVTAQRLTELDRRISAIERAAQGDTPPTAEQLAKRRKN